MWGGVGVRIGRISLCVLVILLGSPAADAASLFTSLRSRVPESLRSRALEPAAPAIVEELAELIAHARHDLNRAILREHANSTFEAPPPGPSPSIDPSATLNSLTMPVVGLNPARLYDSWGDSRDGGRRRHRGIDIFAPRGTQVVAVTAGYLSYIGNWGKGGLSVWLTTDEGLSFYYAHLDRWVPGLSEGMTIQKGEVIGYVGNTGNAASTPPHLHFAVIQNDEAVNPYPVLRRSSRSVAKPILAGGFGGGTQ